MKEVVDSRPYIATGAYATLLRVSLKVLLFFCCIITTTQTVQAQTTDEYEEILVSLTVGGIGTTEIPAVISKDTFYLPIANIFDYLQIKNVTSESLDTVSGFYIQESAPYIIDKVSNTIKYAGQTTTLNEGDLIRTETGLYLKMSYFGKVFGLNAKFNFRSLLTTIISDKELPAVREARMQAIRQNINKMKGDLPADIVMPRKKSLLYFGNFDWSFISTQQTGGKTDNRFGLAAGGMLAGGEVNAVLNYSTAVPFEGRNQYYLWRHVNNDNAALTQMSVGKIIFRPTASLFAPVIGVQFSNTPTTVRQSFGSYVLSNTTDPNWIVELYVNGSLIDYTKADMTGFYKFNVPLMYGNSVIKLRFYGPFGEERSREENITIPFNLLPENKFEYTVSAGKVEDDSSGYIAKINTAYGLSKILTVGGGLEYFGKVPNTPLMPFLNFSSRLSRSLLVFAEYSHGVRSRGILSYRLPSNWQIELGYTVFAKGQKAIINSNALQERRVVVTVPINTGKLSLFSMLTINQSVLPTTNYTSAEWTISSLIKKVETRITTYGVFLSEVTPSIYSNISLGFRLPHRIFLMPQIQYEYSKGEIISVRGTVEKYVFKSGTISMLLEQNLKGNFYNVGMQFRYDLPFSQVGATARYSNKQLATQALARGSIVYDPKSNYVDANNRVNVSRAGIVLSPFLDINCNNVRDPGEPKVHGLKFRCNMGQQMPEDKDTNTRIYNIEPYAKVFIELDKYSFDNIAWQISKPTIKLVAEPNIYRHIDIPIAVVAEISGTVSLQKNDIVKGQGQISICIYQNDSLVARTLSEPDGYYSYMGLAPGQYVVMPDSAQMRRLKMTAPAPTKINIASTPEGDVVSDLDFVIQSLAPVRTNGRKEDEQDEK
jgi:hypothetical protein